MLSQWLSKSSMEFDNHRHQVLMVVRKSTGDLVHLLNKLRLKTPLTIIVVTGVFYDYAKRNYGNKKE